MKAAEQVAGLTALLLVCTTLHAQYKCGLGVAQPSTAGAKLEDNGDGTATDRQGRLMWLRCSAQQTWVGSGCAGLAGKVSWIDAQSYASGVNQQATFFFNDWRLPKLSELASIAELHCADPRIDLAIFPGTPAGAYWSASTRPVEGSQDLAYTLSFGTAGVALVGRTDMNHVRLVRNAL